MTNFILLKYWKYIVAILLLLLAYAGGRYLQPAKIETVIQEKIVTKEVIKKDVVTEIREIVKPDGTKETVTIIKDKTEIAKDTQKDLKVDKIIVNSKPNFKLAGLTGIDANPNGNTIIYGISVEKRIFGPVSAGIWGLTNKTGGLSVSVEF